MVQSAATYLDNADGKDWDVGQSTYRYRTIHEVYDHNHHTYNHNETK